MTLSFPLTIKKPIPARALFLNLILCQALLLGLIDPTLDKALRFVKYLAWRTGWWIIETDPGFFLFGMMLLILLIPGVWFIAKLVDRESKPLGVLTITLLLILVYATGLFCYLTPGDYFGHDGASHIASAWLFKDIIHSEATFPIWTNRWYFGFPLGLYYGNLYYALTGFLSLAFGASIFVTTKFVLIILHVLSGLIVFFFTRYLLKSEAAALFAATFYVFSFQHLGIIISGGALPLSLVFLLLPIPFYCFERFARSELSLFSAALISAVVLAITLMTHIEYGMFCFAAFCLFVSIRICHNVYASGDGRFTRKSVQFILTAAGLFFVFSGWVLVPFAVEKRYLVLGSSNILEGLFYWPGFNRKHAIGLVLWSRLKLDHFYYYMGIVPLCVALYAFRGFSERKCSVFQSYLLSFTFLFFLLLINPRFSNIWLFFASVLSGYGIVAIQRKYAANCSQKRGYVFPLLMVLLLVDLGPTLIQKPYRKLDNSKVRQLEAQLDRNQEIGRILVLTESRHTLWSSLDVIGTNASSIFGGNPFSSVKTHAYAGAIASRATEEVLDRGSHLSTETYNALRLLNVKYVWVPGRKLLIEIPNAYPAWYGYRAKRMKGGSTLEGESWESVRDKYEARKLDYAYVERVVKDMQLDPHNPVVDSVIFADGAQVRSHGRRSRPAMGGGQAFKIIEASEAHETFQVRYESAADGYLHLSYSYFPFNVVKIDGRTVRAYRSAMNFVIVAVPGGEHTVTIAASLSPLRIRLILFGLAGFLVCGSVVIGRTVMARWHRAKP